MNEVTTSTTEEAGTGSNPTTTTPADTTATTNTPNAPTNNVREGTVSSARFNVLCTMVGGGSLSLPLAFQKSGNAFVGPLLLLVTAILSEYCFRILITCARILSPIPNPCTNYTTLGKDTYESITCAAFGTKALTFAKFLVTAMCICGTIGYAVLVRDMLQPITDFIVNAITSSSSNPNNTSGPSLANNITMWTIVILITPVCTLKNLSSLRDLGAASMCSILILGGCILYRSIQCQYYCNTHNIIEDTNTHDMCRNANNTIPSFFYDDKEEILEDRNVVYTFWQLLPNNIKDVLDAFPLFVSVYVCHYNLPLVHNELQNPTNENVRYWLRSTTWSAAMFYLVIGLAGSAYGPCSSSSTNSNYKNGVVHGNILLDFDENDPLLFVGRMCLALTITLAFPLLTIPARDILLRTKLSSYLLTYIKKNATIPTNNSTTTNIMEGGGDSLREPLLVEQQQQTDETIRSVHDSNTDMEADEESPFILRLLFAILVFWSAAAVASCVDSIDTVWDLLGSTLSILLSYLIPAGSYIVIKRQQQRGLYSSSIHNDTSNDENLQEEITTTATTHVETADTQAPQPPGQTTPEVDVSNNNNNELETLVNENNNEDDEISHGTRDYFSNNAATTTTTRNQTLTTTWQDKFSICVAWSIIIIYTPLMILSTVNAVIDTFFEKTV